MGKFCNFYGKRIREEIGSVEVRIFKQTGKECVYLHRKKCFAEYAKGVDNES